MRNLFNAGRILFGISIAVLGIQTIYRHDFPYMLIPPKHSGIPGLAAIAYVYGFALLFAGACIVFKRWIRPASLLLGGLLLLVFCFYFIPYQFMSTNYLNLVEWENAEKELALAAGAFIIAGSFVEKSESGLIKSLGKIVPLSPVLFSITMISFGIIHFQYAKDVADYVPSWVPVRIFWAYLAGAGLLASGVAIILKIKVELAASLLGAMILTWFIVLHVPRVIVSPPAYLYSEITSAFIALAYSATAFVIAGQKPGGPINRSDTAAELL